MAALAQVDYRERTFVERPKAKPVKFIEMAEEFMPPMGGTDHDLLVRLNVFAEIMNREIRDMKNGQAAYSAANDARVRAIELILTDKADKGTVSQLQNFRWWIMGAAAVAGIFAHLLLKPFGL